MLFALGQTPQFALFAYCLQSCKCGTMEQWQGDLVFWLLVELKDNDEDDHFGHLLTNMPKGKVGRAFVGFEREQCCCQSHF